MKWSAAWFRCISIALKLAYSKNKLHKALKGLVIVFPAHFVYDCSTKIFLM